MYTVRQSVVTDASPARDDYTKNPCRTSATLKSYLFIYLYYKKQTHCCNDIFFIGFDGIFIINV